MNSLASGNFVSINQRLQIKIIVKAYKDFEMLFIRENRNLVYFMNYGQIISFL